MTVIRSSRAFSTAHWRIAAAIIAGVGSTVPIEPLAALGGVGALVAVVALFDGGGRIVVITAGGVLILQGSGGATAPKLAYFAFIFLSWMIAVVRLAARRYDRTWNAPFRRLLPGSFVLIGLIVVSGPLALGNGVQIAD
jgi:hypothetical protein